MRLTELKDQEPLSFVVLNAKETTGMFFTRKKEVSFLNANEKREQKRQETIKRMTEESRKKIDELGPRDPNWRNGFLTLWGEVKKTDLNIHNTESQIMILEGQLGKLEAGTDFVEKGKQIRNEVKALMLVKELEKVQLMMTRDHLLRLLGTTWTVRKVWEVISELELLQSEAFSKSETG